MGNNSNHGTILLHKEVTLRQKIGIVAANCYLLPLDTVPLMTYATGYYKMFDMPKVTLLIQIIMVVLCSFWLMLIGPLMGL